MIKINIGAFIKVSSKQRKYFLALQRLFMSVFLIIATSLFALNTAYANEPIAYIGHGEMFDRNGKVILITPNFIENTLKYYSSKLYKQAGEEQKSRFNSMKNKFSNRKKYNKQTNLHIESALTDWLLKEVKPKKAHLIQGKINLIRSKLRYKLSGKTKGSHFKVSNVLQKKLNGIKHPDKIDRDIIGFSTMLSGQDYINECAASGVPIPPAWNSDESTGWNYIGALSDAEEFISAGNEARVYKYDSMAPEGSCIALPRVVGNGAGNSAELLGIICLAKTTSKVCIWDNQQSDMAFTVNLNQTYPLLDFAGGAELLGGSGGVCTTCHAGENPFITHPGTALDFGGLFAANWYDPLVHPDWPQNAGPTNILAGVPSTGDCTTCHTQAGSAGRFPKLSTTLTGYCGTILNRAIGTTMPGSVAYQPHIDALQAMCNDVPSPILRVETLINYREVELGFSFKKALVIHNDGDAALTVSASEISPDADLNQWEDLNEITDTVIQPGGDPIILVQEYKPTSLGAHTIQMQVDSDDPAMPSQIVTLTGIGKDPTPIDSVLVLDRSGSMKDLAGDRKKIDAMRDAAMLYADLLREDIGGTGTGDKLSFVKYNASNSVYMALDFISNAKKNAINAGELSNGALTDASRLLPDGRTGIGGAMQTAAGEIGAALADRKQVMVVLTDGIENESPFINDVIGDIRSANDNLQMYSVGLGFDIEATKLQNITNMGTEGYHQVTDSLTDENLFDLETFYFKIFSNASGMDLVVDPTHVVNLQNLTPVIVDTAKIISSDRSANFLLLDNPALRGFYDLDLISPTGALITTGTTIGGIPLQVLSRRTYRIFRVVFPDIAQEAEYVGTWQLRLTPNGKWSDAAAKDAMKKAAIQGSQTFNPREGMVPIGFAAAVASNYKLKVETLASSFLPGATVKLTGTLTDRGWPAINGQISVKVTSPSNQNYNVKLYDNGSNGDAKANDGVWTNSFLQTASPGVYKFLFQSIGSNERGELAPREASRYVTLMQPEVTPTDVDGQCIPCLLLRALLLLMLLLLIWIFYCTCLKRKLG